MRRLATVRVLAAAALLLCSGASFAQDYFGTVGLEYVRADFAKDQRTYDLLISVGARFELIDYFDVDMSVMVPNPIYTTDRGVRLGGSLFGGFNFLPDSPLTPFVALGVSGLYGELGCDYVYAAGPNGLPGDSRCLRRSATTAGAGYRVGFRIDGGDGKLVCYFSQLHGNNGLRINSINIGAQF